LPVICTSASFHNPEYARTFAAQLSGKEPHDFEAVVGELALRSQPSKGAERDVAALSTIDLKAFYDAVDEPTQFAAVESFLKFRGVPSKGELSQVLFQALADYPPMSLLV